MNPPLTLQQASELLTLQQHRFDHRLQLDLPTLSLRIRANDARLIERLNHYFAPLLNREASGDPPVVEVTVIESPTIESDLPFADWAREAGKQGRKDAYLDFDGGRLVRKVRTGMLFLQSETVRIAVGPCHQNLNQVINFINSQHLNRLQQNGALLGHAAAMRYQGHGVTVAGFSGGGKTTLMLHLMELPEARYITNDRLLLQRDGEQTTGSGIAKWPRINPGTIVHSPRLHPLLSAERRAALLALPEAELWELEEKYDAEIEPLYGPGRIDLHAPIHHLLLLNWKRESRQPTRLQPVELPRRIELLEALLKTSGPFYQDRQGRFSQESDRPDRERYLHVLEPVQSYEISGKIDFEAAKQQLLEHLQ